MSPVLSSSVPCQTLSNEMRAHRRQPPPPHPAFLSTSPPTSAPASGLHFPSSPRLWDVCVLAHLSERRPCGCWWLSLGLTPVTAPHNGVLIGVLFTRHWCHLHTKRLKSWWFLCYGYMHSDDTFKHTNTFVEHMVGQTDRQRATQSVKFKCIVCLYVSFLCVKF